MTASQMYNEFEVTYEAIASDNAPGYEPYEVSILLTQAQDSIIRELASVGVEKDDVSALVLGPFIETSTYTTSAASTMYPSTFEITVDEGDFWRIVNERLKESESGSTIDVRPIDHAFFEANKDNPFKKPDSTRYYWRFIQKNGSDANWCIYGPTAIHTYYINYLEKPDPIIVPGVSLSTVIDGTTINATIFNDGLDCKYNSVIHRTIIDRAAQRGKAIVGDPQGVQLLSTMK